MTHPTKQANSSDSASFNQKDEVLISHQVDFELHETQLKMTKVGAIANIIGGLVALWLLRNQINLGYLITWYAIFAGLNVINIIFSFAFQYCKVTSDKIDKWVHVYHYMMMLPVCLTWGLIGIISLSADFAHQFYIITLLLAVLISFGLGTITDFTASLICILSLMLPSLIAHMYLGIQAIVTHTVDHGLNFGIGIDFLILTTFILVACYVGYKLIKKSINLTYINMLLNRKLEDVNKFLEQRVKERTIELEKSLKLVTYQATHDLLTDLPNQRLLIDYINTAIANSNLQKNSFAVVCLSLNEIDRINDGMGHHVGDLVTQAIANRLSKAFGTKSDNYKITLSRKDVFVIIIYPVTLAEVEKSVSELFSIIDEPVHYEKNIIKLTASLGISTFPQDGQNSKELLMNADAAMLRAKHQGGNAFHIYESKINADIYKKLQLESNLHNAVKNSEFVLQYQPIIDLKSGKICEVEALVRWRHPVHGFIPPIDFIPLAEANGLILPLGEWVLRTACKQLAEWHSQGFDGLRVAVNLSAKQLNQKNITPLIKDILHEAKLNPEFLELELTETEAFKDDTVPILQEFKAMGLCLAVDDFGTGYSGLSNIKQFAIDKLKIDKSFIQDITTNRGSKAIVENIIALARSIHVHVLAEGVETKAQLDALVMSDCDMIQGYYFSPPLNADAIFDLLSGKRLFEYQKKQS